MQIASMCACRALRITDMRKHQWEDVLLSPLFFVMRHIDVHWVIGALRFKTNLTDSIVAMVASFFLVLIIILFYFFFFHPGSIIAMSYSFRIELPV